MADGSSGDLFDPRRLAKLWERPEEDAFEKREREEKEAEEKEPAIAALDLYEAIVLSCRRNLGMRVKPLEPLLAHGRGLLAAKLAADRGETIAAPAEPAAAEAKPAAPADPDDVTMKKLKEHRHTGTDTAADRIKDILDNASLMAGGLEDEKKIAALPGELGAALDRIEDLYEVLSFGSR
jgi:hypothetical protein